MGCVEVGGEGVVVTGGFEVVGGVGRFPEVGDFRGVPDVGWGRVAGEVVRAASGDLSAGIGAWGGVQRGGWWVVWGGEGRGWWLRGIARWWRVECVEGIWRGFGRWIRVVRE